MTSEHQDIPLGKQSLYPEQYAPELLYAIARQEGREQLGVIKSELPFKGVDCWTAYELSWLNQQGQPQMAVAVFYVDANSENIVESKSLKLYLNSLNFYRLASWDAARELLQKDLSACVHEQIKVELFSLTDFQKIRNQAQHFSGICLDQLNVVLDDFQYSAQLLKSRDVAGQQQYFTDCFKSNCLITGQPDWASIMIRVKGQLLDEIALYQYLMSFRCHNEFHEQCVERIFTDIMQQCQPEKLSVYARYTRRGGLDINPFRSNFETMPDNIFYARQ